MASTIDMLLDSNEPSYVGLETEWCASDGGNAFIRVLQISLEVNNAVFNLSRMGVSDGGIQFPSSLKDVMQSSSFVACGENIGIGCSKLEKWELELIGELM